MGQRLDVFSQQVQPLGVAKLVTLDANDLDRARLYVLINCNEMASYLDKFSNGLCVLPVMICYNFSIDDHLPIGLSLMQ
jgi:hypothetical protein